MNRTLQKDVWQPVLFGGCPKWSRSIDRVRIVGDVSAMKFTELDYLFSIFASNGDVSFVLEATESNMRRWLESVDRRSVGAADRYERKLRRHFEKYKGEFVEGYSLPGVPTPQLRVIYDSAAKSERRPTKPNGTTLRSGFSGGEYHWRKWPLSNVRYAQHRVIRGGN